MLLSSIFILYFYELCAGMRFHANVIPIGNKKETIGIETYPQISNLYAELKQTDRWVYADHPAFSESLFQLMHSAISDPNRTFKKSCAESSDFTYSILETIVKPKVLYWIDQL